MQSSADMSRFAGLLVALVAGTALAQPAPDASEHPVADDGGPSESEAPVERPTRPRPERVARVAKVPLRVVKILAESEQALLFDKNRGRHVLVEVGDTVGDYVVELIDEEDVTLTGRDQETVVLAGPDRPWRRDRGAADRPAPARAPAAATPVDPYAPVAPDGGDLDEPVRSVSAAGIGAPAGAPAFDDAATPYDDVPAVSMAAPPAPATLDASAPPAPTPSPAPATLDASPPLAPSVAPTTIPPTAPPAAAAPTVPPSVTPAAPAAAAPPPAPPPPGPSPLAEALAAEAAGGAPAPLPSPSSKPAPTVISGGATATPAAAGTVTLPRREVDAALANFGTLAGSIRASFGKHGLELKTVAAGSIFARAGLRSGDVVTAVNGKPLRTLDDAADLYASAGTLRAATVQLRRGGKPQTLRIAIQ